MGRIIPEEGAQLTGSMGRMSITLSTSFELSSLSTLPLRMQVPSSE